MPRSFCVDGFAQAGDACSLYIHSFCIKFDIAVKDITMKLEQKNIADQGGGGQLPLRQKTLHGFCTRICCVASGFLSRKSSAGAILIEFAFSVPVFLALIYYLHDVPKVNRYNEQMKFVSYQLAQILQTTSKYRANKAITKRDLKYAADAAYLSIYPGTSMRTKGGLGGPFVGPGFPNGAIYYVKCDASGRASVKWILHYQYGGASTGGVFHIANELRSRVKVLSNAAPESIYPGLKMQPGEAKILVAPIIFYSPEETYYIKVDGRRWNQSTTREEFGFLFASPPHNGVSHEFYFENVAVFAPSAGLFSETVPADR